MNQGEFADSVGISRGAMSYYEQESRTPDIGVLRAICVKYNISADYLLGIAVDPSHEVADICRETGLWPKVARKLRLIRQLQETDIESALTVVEKFEAEDVQEALELTGFISATPMMNLLISTEEGLSILNLLGAIILGADLITGSDKKPFFRFRNNAHRNLTVEFPLENITAALWVNIQQSTETLKQKVEASMAKQQE
jgi:transcriptional regulator with XRE-family HTH domain